MPWSPTFTATSRLRHTARKTLLLAPLPSTPRSLTSLNTRSACKIEYRQSSKSGGDEEGQASNKSCRKAHGELVKLKLKWCTTSTKHQLMTWLCTEYASQMHLDAFMCPCTGSQSPGMLKSMQNSFVFRLTSGRRDKQALS